MSNTFSRKSYCSLHYATKVSIHELNIFFFPVPVCAITASGVPDGTFVSMNRLVPCAGD
jgi:hypothetical protein